MTILQKLELRRSEIKSRLGELAALDTLTDEQKAETDRLTKEFQEKETQYRAAVIAEGERAQTREFGNDGEAAEIRAIKRRSSLRNYLDAAGKGVGLAGAEAELNDALEIRVGGGVRVPWTMLLPDVEFRADAVSDTTALDGGTAQRPILRRLFGRSILDALGVRIDSVPAGDERVAACLTAGVAPDQVAESVQKDAVKPTFTTVSLKPKRLTGRYVFTVEQAAQVAGIEAALRRDLADAVMAKMSNQLIDGDGTAPNVKGFLTALTEPAVPGSESGYADYAAVGAQGVDGIHAELESEVCVLLGVASYKHAAQITGNDEFATDALKRRVKMALTTSYLPAPPSSGNKANSQDSLIHSRGSDSAEMRGDSVAAMWPSLELIRDIYTKAGEGQVILTWTALWDAETAYRSGAYQRVKFKLAA